MTSNNEIVFKRDLEVKELFDSINIPVVKVIVGLRRAGKSYLLNNLFKNELIKNGYPSDSIFIMDLSAEYSFVRNPESLKTIFDELNKTVIRFVFIDEVQLAGDGYQDILISFVKTHTDISVYVTGSNSKILSDDIRKSFKENGKRIFLRPLSYSTIHEVMPEYSIDDYFKYGALPIVLKKPANERLAFLKELYDDTYLNDIKERFQSTYLSEQEKANIVVCILSNMMSPISELEIIKGITKQHKLDNNKLQILKKEILDFIDTASSSFLLIDFKDGKKYNEKTPTDFINHNIKKYCFDVGLLNVVSTAMPKIKNSSVFENAIYLELLARGIESEGYSVLKPNGEYGEIDFAFSNDGKRYYIQAAVTLSENDKDREIGNLKLINEESTKVVTFVNNNLLSPIPISIEPLQIKDLLLNFKFK